MPPLDLDPNSRNSLSLEKNSNFIFKSFVIINPRISVRLTKEFLQMTTLGLESYG
jgi:hypothetical protein